MGGCNLIGFNLEACVWSAAGGIGGMLPWPVWLVLALLLIGIVWRFAGWPGLVTLGGAVGFILGRRSAVEDDEIWPDADRGKRPKAKQRRPTIRDLWRRK